MEYLKPKIIVHQAEYLLNFDIRKENIHIPVPPPMLVIVFWWNNCLYKGSSLTAMLFFAILTSGISAVLVFNRRAAMKF